MGEAKRRREAATILPFCHSLDVNIVDQVCQADHEWFEANPEHTRRFRPVVMGEVGGEVPGGFHYCIVTYIGPGVRMRQFVHFARAIDWELSEAEIAKLAAWAVNPERHSFPPLRPLTEGG
jgi:hypothetical protein